MFSVNHLCVCVDFVAKFSIQTNRIADLGPFQAYTTIDVRANFPKFYINVYFAHDSIQALAQSTPLTANVLHHKLNVQGIILMANIDLWLETAVDGVRFRFAHSTSQQMYLHKRSNITWNIQMWRAFVVVFFSILRFAIDMCRMSIRFKILLMALEVVINECFETVRFVFDASLSTACVQISHSIFVRRICHCAIKY